MRRRTHLDPANPSVVDYNHAQKGEKVTQHGDSRQVVARLVA